MSIAALLASESLISTVDATDVDVYGDAFDLYDDDYDFAQVDEIDQDDLSDLELAQVDAEFLNAVDDPEIAMINA